MPVIKYPDGREMDPSLLDKKVDKRKTSAKSEEEKTREHILKANMGMSFEKDISSSCDYYRLNNIAVIYKRPTPIKIVKMSKENKNMISEAYFEAKSTTDYVGIYKGKYIDFECKETIHDAVPYHMIRQQQYEHLKSIINLGGIGFFLVSFKKYQQVYLMKASIILDEVLKKLHPGFKLDFFKENGVLVKRGYNPPYYLIEAIEEAFQKELN